MRVQFIYCELCALTRARKCVRLCAIARTKSLFISSNDDNNNEIIFYLFLQMRMNTRAHSNATKTLDRSCSPNWIRIEEQNSATECVQSSFCMCLPLCECMCSRPISAKYFDDSIRNSKMFVPSFFLLFFVVVVVVVFSPFSVWCACE